MNPGSVLVNVARGEIIDEPALIAALGEGHLRGIALDVYNGEFERPPSPELWQHPRVMITLRISATAMPTDMVGLACPVRTFVLGWTVRRCGIWSTGNGGINHTLPTHKRDSSSVITEQKDMQLHVKGENGAFKARQRSLLH